MIKESSNQKKVINFSILSVNEQSRIVVKITGEFLKTLQ